jgi:N-acetylneuraminate synthase
VEVIEKFNVPLCLMHCILNYPTKDENAHLGMIPDLIRRFPKSVPGYSDHTLPKKMETLKVANLLGAVILEKHFTHDKALPGNDHYHAMDKEDLKVFNQQMEQVYTLVGDNSKHPLPSEEISRNNARRSLVAVAKISKGQVVGEEHLTWKRPASGISPKEITKLLGKKALVDIEEDSVLYWNMFS